MTAGNQATAHTALVHRFVDEFWSRGNLSVVDELMTRDAVIHEPVAWDAGGSQGRRHNDSDGVPRLALHGGGDRCRGRPSRRAVDRSWHPPGRVPGYPPTGKRVAVPGVVFYRIADGKIAEFRGQFDRMSLMEQLGAVPNSNTPAP